MAPFESTILTVCIGAIFAVLIGGRIMPDEPGFPIPGRWRRVIGLLDLGLTVFVVFAVFLVVVFVVDKEGSGQTLNPVDRAATESLLLACGLYVVARVLLRRLLPMLWTRPEAPYLDLKFNWGLMLGVVAEVMIVFTPIVGISEGPAIVVGFGLVALPVAVVLVGGELPQHWPRLCDRLSYRYASSRGWRARQMPVALPGVESGLILLSFETSENRVLVDAHQATKYAKHLDRARAANGSQDDTEPSKAHLDWPILGKLRLESDDRYLCTCRVQSWRRLDWCYFDVTHAIGTVIRPSDRSEGASPGS